MWAGEGLGGLSAEKGSRQGEGGGLGVSSDAAFTSDSSSEQVPRTDTAQTSSIFRVKISFPSVSCVRNESKRRKKMKAD